MSVTFTVTFDTHADADVWHGILLYQELDTDQRGKSVTWDICLTARAPETDCEHPFEACDCDGPAFHHTYAADRDGLPCCDVCGGVRGAAVHGGLSVEEVRKYNRREEE